jgi:hypothetical protein
VGDYFDLQTLSELFSVGDPRVARDQLNGYYVESSDIVVSGVQPDVSPAEALVRRVNGAARVLASDFQPVQLGGRYTSPDGATSVVLAGDTARVRDRAVVGVVMIDGVAAPTPPPKGPRYLKLAQQDPDVADALRVVGQPSRLDWYVLQLPFHGECLTSTSLVTRGPRSRLRRVAAEAGVTIGTQAGGGDTRDGRGQFP